MIAARITRSAPAHAPTSPSRISSISFPIPSRHWGNRPALNSNSWKIPGSWSWIFMSRPRAERRRISRGMACSSTKPRSATAPPSFQARFPAPSLPMGRGTSAPAARTFSPIRLAVSNRPSATSSAPVLSLLPQATNRAARRSPRLFSPAPTLGRTLFRCRPTASTKRKLWSTGWERVAPARRGVQATPRCMPICWTSI